MTTLGYGYVGVAPGTTTIRLGDGLGTQQCPPDVLPIHIAPDQSRYLKITKGHGTVRYWSPYATEGQMKGWWPPTSPLAQAAALIGALGAGFAGAYVVISILKTGR